MHHMCANTGSATTAVALDIPPVQDGIMTINNNHFVPRQPLYIGAVQGLCSTLDSLRIVTPTFRQISNPYVRPLGTAVIGSARPMAVMNRLRNPLLVKANEEIEMLGLQSSGGSLRITTMVKLFDSPPQPIGGGNVYCMNGTGTTTQTANAWTQCPITWVDSLPAGNYNCIGAEFWGTNAQAARFTFQNQWMRPGCFGQTTDLLLPWGPDVDGSQGVWGSFTGQTMPLVECLSNAADTAQNIYLYFQTA